MNCCDNINTRGKARLGNESEQPMITNNILIIISEIIEACFSELFCLFENGDVMKLIESLFTFVYMQTGVTTLRTCTAFYIHQSIL